MRASLVVIATVVIAGCGGPAAPSVAVSSPTPPPTFEPTPGPTFEPTPSPTFDGASPSQSMFARLPPPNAGFDYQLGGAYPPPAGVTVVSRDRTAAPEPGFYNICYVNGFQIQSDDVQWWKTNHPDLMLRDKAGKVVVDPDWDEIMLAPTTPERRAELAGVIGAWVAKCASDGFDAVEIDNLDTFTRSHRLITEDDAVAQMRLFADAAHAVGLPVAQKNSAEIAGRRTEMGTDFAVAEECDRYRECDAYTGAYGDHVLVIEYRRRDFEAGCAAFPDLSIILRDLDLVTPADKGYVYDSC